jgi:hypothetical protein
MDQNQILENLLLANIKWSYMIIKITKFWPILKKFLYRLVLRIREIIGAPPMVQSKIFLPKILLFMHN